MSEIIATTQLTAPIAKLLDQQQADHDLSLIMQRSAAQQLAKISKRRTDVRCPECFTVRSRRIAECDCTAQGSRVRT